MVTVGDTQFQGFFFFKIFLLSIFVVESLQSSIFQGFIFFPEVTFLQLLIKKKDGMPVYFFLWLEGFRTLLSGDRLKIFFLNISGVPPFTGTVLRHAWNYLWPPQDLLPSQWLSPSLLSHHFQTTLLLLLSLQGLHLMSQHVHWKKKPHWTYLPKLIFTLVTK